MGKKLGSVNPTPLLRMNPKISRNINNTPIGCNIKPKNPYLVLLILVLRSIYFNASRTLFCLINPCINFDKDILI